MSEKYDSLPQSTKTSLMWYFIFELREKKGKLENTDAMTKKGIKIFLPPGITTEDLPDEIRKECIEKENGAIQKAADRKNKGTPKRRSKKS